jgi:hypothetical protein
MRETFVSEFLRSAKQAPRIYFAPLVGAVKEIRAELLRPYSDDDKKLGQAAQSDKKNQ